MGPPEVERDPHRRAFLRRGCQGIAGVALASLLSQEGLLADGMVDANAPRPPHFPGSARNCICLFMSGGPSQLDLFDAKPRLNKDHGRPLPGSILEKAQLAFGRKETARLMGTPFRFDRHGESGLAFSELLPHLATCADEIAMVRSMHTDSFNHLPAQVMMNSGFTRAGRPTLGSWLAYGLGSESRDLPAYVVLTNGADNGASNWSSGFLPSNYQGVALRREGPPIPHLEAPAGLQPETQRRSLEALGKLGRLAYERTGDREILERVANYELAFRMQAAAPGLIDLSGESARTRAAYGLDADDPGARAFAGNCLLARRLVERGVRFVTIYHGDWDAHFDLAENHRARCAEVDRPLAALLRDLKARGLLASTLVLWTSEFGRTPIGEDRPQRDGVSGRDHHTASFTTWLAGGGVPGGQVVGATDEIGWEITEDPVHVHDLHATLLHLFGLDHTRLTYRHQGRDFRLTDVGGRVVRRLVG
ncbi:MAG: DUF1501 domain-containing protein [Isosphaeraceae bacterium]